MNGLKSLKDFLSSEVKSQELYTSDQKSKLRRAKKGMYSRQDDCFDFIHLVQNWEQIVGPMLSQNTAPLKVKGDSLIVITKHAIFSHELSFMTPILIKKINKMFPKFSNQFSKIKFINSEKYFNLPQKIDARVNQSAKFNGHAFSPFHQRKLADAKKLFEDLDDEETKELLISLYLQQS